MIPGRSCGTCEDYARGVTTTATGTRSPVISAGELRSLLAEDSSPVRIVDCRWTLGKPGAGAEAYAEGHLPNAMHLDLDADLADPEGFGAPGRHPLPSPRAFETRLAKAGIGDEHLVVAYDDVGGWIAARLWWMLDNLGHHEVAVLDGGIAAWKATGGALTTDVPKWPRARLHLDAAWSGVISREELKERLGTVVLLDSRAAARYRGETEPVDPVAGHIPGAVSAPATGNVAADGRFLAGAALRQRFAGLGVPEVPAAGPAAGGPPVGAYCGSGVTAAHEVLALALAGIPAALYPGSWSEWVTDPQRPVATGPEPG